MNRLEPMKVELRGTTLIEASAGTGKTFTITTLYLRMLLERELVVSEILVVTYTRAATAELRDRIRQRISHALLAFETNDPGADPVLEALLTSFDSEAKRKRATGRLASALVDFDEAAILTIHGFCQRVLRENAFESLASFDSELLLDQHALLQEIVGDYWSTRLSKEGESFIRYLKREKVSVRSLEQLAQHAEGGSPVSILPETRPVEDESLARLEVDFQQARERTLELWSASKEEVIALLHAAAKDRVLNNNTFKPAAILTSWMREMDLALEDPSPSLGKRSKVFKRYTVTILTERTNGEETTPTHPLFEECEKLEAVDRALDEALFNRKLEFEREAIATVEVESHRRKERDGQLSYDDLLRQVASALRPPGAELLSKRLRRQFVVALVDEFQDTDQLQYEIFRRIWHSDDSPGDEAQGEPALFLIGDPKQAVYAFRGADVHAYLAAKRDAGERCFTLDTNWRSDPSMISAVNDLFGRLDQPFRLDGIPFEPIEPCPDARDHLISSPSEASAAPALEILFAPRSDEKPLSTTFARSELPRQIAVDIAELLQSDTRIKGEPVTPGDIAVLCRTNPQIHDIAQALRHVGVPAALLGTASVFDGEDAADMQRVIEAIAEPGSPRLIRAALATRVFNLSAQDLDSLLRDEQAWDHWILQFQTWHDVFVDRGFIRMLHQMFRSEGVHAKLLGIEEGDRRLTNFLHLAELLEQAAIENHLGLQSLARWLASMRLDRSMRQNSIGDEGEMRIESDADAVKVVTVHKSKGLEYPIVYCPYLWGAAKLRDHEKNWVRFHDPDHEDEMMLDLGSPEHQEHQDIAAEESLAESRRLLYVALTRAKHRCSVVWGNFNDAEGSPLAELLHPDLEISFDFDALTTSDERSKARKNLKASFKQQSDADLRAEVESLCESSNGAIATRPLQEGSATRIENDVPSADLQHARASRKISSSFRHSSFSALAKTDTSRRHELPRSSEEGFDYDAVPEPVGVAPVEGDEPPVPLDRFPAGAAAGTLLHSILEHLAFQTPTREQDRDIVADALSERGFDVGWHDELCDALDRMLATRWSEAGPRLADLSLHQRLDEMEFMLPVAGDPDGASENLEMTVSDLAEVFATHATSDFQRVYATRLGELGFEPLAGYLRGYVDLVFEWEGRFYVVDYKSNHLGPSASNYDPSELEAPMFENHYVLQYHLYTVALDRYLSLRVPDYDYETHFGGVYYLFLRGLDHAHPTGCGVYHDRPSRELIAGLAMTLAKPAGAAA